jgi:hypothetical protein
MPATNAQQPVAWISSEQSSSCANVFTRKPRMPSTNARRVSANARTRSAGTRRSALMGLTLIAGYRCAKA